MKLLSGDELLLILLLLILIDSSPVKGGLVLPWCSATDRFGAKIGDPDNNEHASGGSKDAW